MTTARQQVSKVKEVLDEGRISKEKRDTIDRFLGSVSNDLPVAVDSIASPLVDPEWYGAKYYFEYKDMDSARIEAPGYASVRAVNIDHMTDYDFKERRSPSSWSPRVELTLKTITESAGGTQSSRTLVGDLSKDEAIKLATKLLAAASLLR